MMNAVARLLVKTGNLGLLLLRPGHYCIGRHSDCDLILDTPAASRRHAEIAVDEQHNSTITDLHSQNGTYVNSVRIEARQFVNGDIIQIGSTLSVFETLTHDEFTDSESTPALITPKQIDPELSPAEQRVLVSLLVGLSEKAIAVKLSISRHTVHNHVKQIYRAYQVNARSELLAYFITRPI